MIKDRKINVNEDNNEPNAGKILDEKEPKDQKIGKDQNLDTNLKIVKDQKIKRYCKYFYMPA